MTESENLEVAGPLRPEVEKASRAIEAALGAWARSAATMATPDLLRRLGWPSPAVDRLFDAFDRLLILLMTSTEPVILDQVVAQLRRFESLSVNRLFAQLGVVPHPIGRIRLLMGLAQVGADEPLAVDWTALTALAICAMEVPELGRLLRLVLPPVGAVATTPAPASSTATCR